MSRAGGGRPRADLRSTAIEAVRKLTEAGYTAYFAGGCVRDRLMGVEPTDYDIATNARPDQVAGVFRSAHFVGESFGVTLVRRGGHLLHVATFRTDGDYSDGRHPDSITYSDAEHDARRRDFTINGLFEDPAREEIIDFVGGRADLDGRLVRAIGDPAARLREDPLRTLRAIRFAARFGFEIEQDTAEAIRAAAGDLRGVSRERIGEELKRMLAHPNRAVAAWTLQYLGLDADVLGEPHQDVAPQRLARLPDETPTATGLAAWLLDRHEAAGGGAAGGAGGGAGGGGPGVMERARGWSAALLLSNAEQALLREVLAVHALLATPEWDGLGVAAQKRLAGRPNFDQALVVLRAADPQRFVDVQRRVQELARSGGLTPAALIDGSDLLAMGLESGPAFRDILDRVYDAQLEGTVADRPQALALARALAGGAADPC